MLSADGVVAMLHSTATQWQHSFSLDTHLEEGALLLSGILSGSKSYGDERLTVICKMLTRICANKSCTVNDSNFSHLDQIFNLIKLLQF